MIDYIVYIQNDWNEQMTFRFKEIHHALTLYHSAMNDTTVTIVVVDCVEYDDNNPESFTNGQVLRVYERDLNVRN